MLTILVTGGAGFLGSNLCKKLLEDEENRVICIDDFSSGKMEHIRDLIKNDRFELINHDIINMTDIEVSQIYNAACPASPRFYQKDYLKTFDTCVTGTRNMLELAKKYNAKMLQFSTSEIYGNPLEHPQSENYFGNVNTMGIRSCYDEGKRAAETMCFIYNREYNVRTKIVRIFNTYGPNMREDDGRVISNFINRAIKNEDLEIYGDGSNTRSLCYVDDLIDGIIKMMNSKDNLIGPINLGNTDELTINEIAKKVINLANSKSKIIYKEPVQDDPICRKPDLSLAKELLGYCPKIKIEDGIKKTIDYYNSLETPQS